MSDTNAALFVRVLVSPPSNQFGLLPNTDPNNPEVQPLPHTMAQHVKSFSTMPIHCPKHIVIALTGSMKNAQGVHIGTSKVGKSTVAMLIQGFCQQRGYDFQEIAFADALKDTVVKAYGLRRADYDTPEKKELEIAGLGYSFRNLLRIFGTEVVRKNMGLDTLWCDVVLDKLKQREQQQADSLVSHMFGRVRSSHVQTTLKRGLVEALRKARLPPLTSDNRLKVTVVSDMRFPVEYESLRKRPGGCFVVQIQRHADAKTHTSHSTHSSERNYGSLMMPDMVLQNQGTLPELCQKVHAWLSNWFGEGET